MSEKIGEGGVNIDRAVYEGGIGLETATSTGDVSAIERTQAEFETFLTGLAHGCVDFDQLAGWYFDQKAELSALRATIERLTREKQDEFDIASGYYKQLQKAKDTVEAQAAEIGRLRQVAQLAADMAGEDDGRALAAMAEMTAIVAKEALFDSPVDPHSPTPTGKIERLQRAASRACDVMSECVEHSECSGADRAEMKAAKQQLLDALLGNSSGSPNGSLAVVPVERLREIEWAIPIDRGDRMDGMCPGCAGSQEEGFHAPGCWIGNALRDAEREKA